MPHVFKDGTIGSSNFRLVNKKGTLTNKNQDYNIIKARIDEILYVDDEMNPTKDTNNPQVIYNCTIIGGFDAGKKVTNVVDMSYMGGPYSGSERVREPMIEKDFSGRTEKTPPNTHGEIVLLVRLYGAPGGYVIIGALKHPKFSKAAKKADGQRLYWEYNGFTFEINRDGALTATFGGGPKDADGEPTDEEAAGSKIVFSKNGSIDLIDKEGSGIKIDAENKKVELIAGTGGMEISSGANWNIQVSGNASIQADGNVELNGSMVALGGGGVGVARIGSVVMGTDGEGRPITAWVDTGGSSLKVTAAG